MKENTIKICHVSQLLTGKSDGIFTHIKMIINALDKEKFTHVLIFQGGEEEVYKKLNSSNIKIYSVKQLKNSFSILGVIKVLRIIKKEEVDIIQTHSTKMYILIGLLNFVLRKRHIFNYNGVFINNSYYSLPKKILLYLLHWLIYYTNNCDLVIGPSKKSLDVLKIETKKFKKFNFYYNTFVEDSKEKTDSYFEKFLITKKSTKFLIGIISRVEIQKRIDLALELVKLFKENNKKRVFFVFAGDGPQLEEMKITAQKMDLMEYLIFWGYVPNIKLYLKYFDVILFTSEWEGFPLTIWESLKEGTPIISSNVGGVEEILINENCGLVYEFGDIMKCYELIIELINNSELYKTLKSNCKRTYSKFNKNNFVEFFTNLYQNLL